MNIIDRIVNFFSPQAGLNRQLARTQTDLLSKRFNDSSKPSRAVGGIYGSREGGDLQLPQLRTLQDKSTFLYRTNPHANKAIRAMTSRVVGRGFECESLAITPEGNSFDLFRLEAQQVWKSWNGNCHSSGKPGFGGLSFNEIQTLAFQESVKTGEVLIHFRRLSPVQMDFYQTDIPLQIELIEAQRLADDGDCKNIITGNKIYRGIEFDVDGKRIAYHVYKNNPYNELTLGDRTTVRIPVSEMLHIYRKETPSQQRGTPRLAPVLDTLHNMGDLVFDELTAAKIGACTVMAVENSNSNSSIPLPINPGSEQTGTEYTQMYPGMIANLAPGQKLQGFSPNRPNLDVNEFVTNLLRGVAAGIPCVKASEIHMDFREASFSSEKAAENSAFAEVQEWQEWFSSQFLKPIYREVINAALLAGLFSSVSIGDSGTGDDVLYGKKQNLLEANFRGPGTRSINPVDDQNALILAKQNGTLSLQETAAMEGSDWRETIRNNQQVYLYAIAQGCTELIAERLAFGNMIAPIQIAQQEETPKEKNK